MSYQSFHRERGCLALDISAYHLEQYAMCDDPIIRMDVAEHPNVTPEILSRLAKDTYANIRWHVAKNLKTPLESLLALRYDEYASIAWSACIHPCLSFQDQVFVDRYNILVKNLP